MKTSLLNISIKNIFLLATLILFTSICSAVTKTWVGGATGNPTDWNTAANWSTSGIPGSGDNVIIGATTNLPTLSAAGTCASLTINGNTTLTIPSGVTLSVVGSLTVGSSSVHPVVSVPGTGSLSIGGDYNNYGTVTFGSGPLTFSGNYTDNYFPTSFGTGLVTFNSTSSSAKITVIPNDVLTFTNIAFANGQFNFKSQTGATAGFAVTSNGVLTLSANAQLIFSNTFGLTLYSDANGSASIAAIPTGCTIKSSKIYVQRYISGTRGWRFLSSPVNNATTDAYNNTVCSIKYLQNSIYISGATGTAGGFDWAGNPSLFLYREDITPNSGTFSNTNFRAINGLTTDPTYPVLYESGSYSIPQANGYQVFIRGDRTTPGTSMTAQQSTTYTFSSVTLTASGTLNQGQIRFINWYTPSSLYLSNQNTNPNLKGFNLVGNPYPSSIDWDTFNSTSSTSGIYGNGVSNYIYSYNFTNKQYAVYQAGTGGSGPNGGSNIIGSGQGFFVVANATNPTLIFNESAKTNSSYKGVTTLMSKGTIAASTPQVILLRMALDSINTDETMMVFNSSAKSVFDPIEDAPYKVGGGRVSLNSLSADSVAIAINHLPFVNGQPVRLNIGASASNTYSLKLQELRGIPQMYDVWLKDALVGDSVNLRKTNTYSFAIDKSNTATFGNKRFSITVKQDPAYAYKLLAFTVARLGNSSNVEIRWQTANEGNYTNFTVERSTDGGQTFTVVGGMWGNGSGDYGLMDKDVQIGTIFYRLKSQDINNAIYYSDLGRVVITDKGNNNLDVLRVYPNPATNVVNLEVQDKKDNTTYNIIVSNSTGFIVKQAKSSQANWQTSISDLLPGTYLVRVVNSKTLDFVGESKFIKL